MSELADEWTFPSVSSPPSDYFHWGAGGVSAPDGFDDWAIVDEQFKAAFDVAAQRHQADETLVADANNNNDDDDDDKEDEEEAKHERPALGPSPVPLAVAQPVAPALATALTFSAEDERLLNLPRRICDAANSGDLDALRALIDAEMVADCSVKTKALVKPLDGRQFVFRFFAALLEKHPDCFHVYQQSFLDRAGNVIWRSVFSGTSVQQEVADSYLFVNKSECRTVGYLTRMIIEGTRRYFFASERQRLAKTEKRITEGKGLARIELHCVGKLTPSKEGKIRKFEVSWKFKELQCVSLSQP